MAKLKLSVVLDVPNEGDAEQLKREMIKEV